MMATVNVYASNNNNNNREFIERFRRLKALYSLRKQQQHNAQIAIYKSVEYNEANNTFKKKKYNHFHEKHGKTLNVYIDV